MRSPGWPNSATRVCISEAEFQQAKAKALS